MLVRLPLIAGRDIEVRAFGVSGGENGLCNSCSTGGETGVFGRGFSRLRLLVLRSCFLNRGDRFSELADFGVGSGVADFARSPVWMFVGLLRPSDTEPNFLMPLRTPARKSPLSGDGIAASSSVADSEGVENFDSRVSLSDMISHA